MIPRQAFGRVVELAGGPLDGRRVVVEDDPAWIAFHDKPRGGLVAVYVPTGRRTADGLEILESTVAPLDVRRT